RTERAVMRSRPSLDHRPSGRVSQVPNRSITTRRPLSTRRARPVPMPVATRPMAGFTRCGRLATLSCVTRPKRVQYLQLAASPREASDPGLLRRLLAWLHVERAIYMASSFQLARPARLRLAHRTHNSSFVGREKQVGRSFTSAGVSPGVVQDRAV